MDQAMLKKLKANNSELAECWEALNRVAEWDSAVAEAVRTRIDALANDTARIMEVSEDEIADIEANVEAEIRDEIAATWRVLEANPGAAAEDKKFIEKMKE